MRVTETIVTTVTTTVTYLEGDDFELDHEVDVNADDRGLAAVSRELLWSLVEGQGKTLALAARNAWKGEIEVAVTLVDTEVEEDDR